jgi:hypothetical protein
LILYYLIWEREPSRAHPTIWEAPKQAEDRDVEKVFVKHERENENRANQSASKRIPIKQTEVSTEKEKGKENGKEKGNVVNHPEIIASASKKRRLAEVAPDIASPSMISSLSSLSGDRPPLQKKTKTAQEKVEKKDENRANKSQSSFQRILAEEREFRTEREKGKEKEKENVLKPLMIHSAPKQLEKKDENRANKTQSSSQRVPVKQTEVSTEKEKGKENGKEKGNVVNHPEIIASASKKRRLAEVAPDIASPSMISSLSSLSGDRPPPQKKTKTAQEKFHERWMEEREEEDDEAGGNARWRKKWTKDEDRA